ncbi:hypothetical protein SHELI_v1c01260 [Spiroplasma helicoides]|uniref:Uncharacterized protein n=1 Tax=Spiroplasma helicoides TaxID=216938 RepID=A0A1B3SJI6_9MOLU|nr:hypothetical protein [Spiroplasma helicoides]AOG60081.1 hypothetical protein SHELI_v1c01260 [Spiroplasma helicoides]
MYYVLVIKRDFYVVDPNMRMIALFNTFAQAIKLSDMLNAQRALFENSGKPQAAFDAYVDRLIASFGGVNMINPSGPGPRMSSRYGGLYDNSTKLLGYGNEWGMDNFNQPFRRTDMNRGFNQFGGFDDSNDVDYMSRNESNGNYYSRENNRGQRYNNNYRDDFDNPRYNQGPYQPMDRNQNYYGKDKNDYYDNSGYGYDQQRYRDDRNERYSRNEWNEWNDHEDRNSRYDRNDRDRNDRDRIERTQRLEYNEKRFENKEESRTNDRDSVKRFNNEKNNKNSEPKSALFNYYEDDDSGKRSRSKETARYSSGKSTYDDDEYIEKSMDKSIEQDVEFLTNKTSRKSDSTGNTGEMFLSEAEISKFIKKLASGKEVEDKK